MHILVTNDDGPPSNQSSPYVHAFVQTLQKAGHLVSVILPHQQRSWIGKAHFVGQTTKPTYFRPGTIHKNDGTTHSRPLPFHEDGEEWVLINNTPAACAQLGLYHFFQDRPPVDLVVSGPNYGRNSTALFSLSSGTIGGAMEAATCQTRAIALSFAFFNRNHDPELIAGACRHSVRLIEHIYHNWIPDADVYSLNVPLIPDVESHKTVYTCSLQNHWTSGSSFEEIEATENDDQDPQTQERDIREGSPGPDLTAKPTRHKHRHFKWRPQFGDVQESIDASPPGNDGWAIQQGYSSVTPLKANFMHATDIPFGELKLSSSNDHASYSLLFAVIDADPYVLPLIRSALSAHFAKGSYKLIDSVEQRSRLNVPLLQIAPYEDLDFTHLLAHPRTSLANSYIIRKALIRKHYLHNTIVTWWSKHPEDTVLKGHVPLTVSFEIDYVDFLDEALAECWELHDSFAKEQREWWILKPGMSDQGQGIRLFSREEDLKAIFAEWEDEEDLNEEDEEADSPLAISNQDVTGAGTMTSQLRHFIAQRYIEQPLLLRSHEHRKFHIRSYVLAVGALRTYVYKDMLALFAPLPYMPPGPATCETSDHPIDPQVHLTNTCLQAGSRKDSIFRFWDLTESPPGLSEAWKTNAFDRICRATGTLFEAAAREQMVHFQTLENAFEVFGVDWIIDQQGMPWLLEVNAFPDFKQSGEDLKDVILGLWNGVIGVAVKGFFGPANENQPGHEEELYGLRKVLDLDLRRR